MGGSSSSNQCCGPLLQIRPARCPATPKPGCNGGSSSSLSTSPLSCPEVPASDTPPPAPVKPGVFGRLCCCSRRSKTPKSASAPINGQSQASNVSTLGDGLRSPTLEGLNEKKRALVVEMRSRLDALPLGTKPPRRHDLWLKRYLAHTSWKVDKALKLYLEFEDWRKKHNVDSMLTAHPTGDVPCMLEDCVQFIPYGRDRRGRLISLMSVSSWPWWRQLFEPLDDMILSQIWIAEWLDHLAVRHARETGDWLERAVILMDMRRMDSAYFWGMANNSRVRQRSHLTGKPASYYPGLIDRAYIINAPSFAKTMWNGFKLILSQSLMEKATMIASDADQMAMVEELGPENVPRELGGTCDKPDPSLMPPPLRMPEAGWASVIESWTPQVIVIDRGATHEATLQVPAGGTARWKWALFEKSVYFEVSQRQGVGEFQVVAESHEVAFNAAEDPLIGEVPAPEGGGEIRLVWDNTKSKLWSKTLLLRFEVVEV